MWKVKIIQTIGLFGIALFSFFLSQSPLFVQDSSATSQSFTFSDASSHVYCGYGDTPSCSDYSYIKIDFSDLSRDYADGYFLQSGSNFVIRFRFGDNTDRYFYNNVYIYPSICFNYSDLVFNSHSPSRLQNSVVTSSDHFSFSSYTVTFSTDDICSSNITPSGSLSITENGTFDVTDYAEVNVDIECEECASGSNYHQDLVDLKHAIYVGVAVLLVIYFFWLIYRIIIINTRR